MRSYGLKMGIWVLRMGDEVAEVHYIYSAIRPSRLVSPRLSESFKLQLHTVNTTITLAYI